MWVIEIEEIDTNQAESVCRRITTDLPEYFGIPSENETYFKGVHSCKNFAAKHAEKTVGLISLNLPYANNSHIYWMGVLRQYQAKGVGSRMLEAACQFTRKSHASTMTVETLAPDQADDNYLKTWQFYLARGFKPLINIKPQGYEWNMVYMVKPLSHVLDALLTLENDARDFGFEWPDEQMIIEQAIDECREIKEAIKNGESRDRLQEEIGDLLHSVISLCDFEGFDVENTLAKVTTKFGNRMQAVKQLTHASGLFTLKGQSFEFMLEVWRNAKIVVQD